MKTQKYLDLKIDNGDFDSEITIREYLKLLLKTIWLEGECFSSKRPFGNSDWEYDLYIPLIKAGFVKGKLDEDGYVEEFETEAQKAANRIIFYCIDDLY